MLNPYEEREPRASASLVVDFARFTKTEVTFLPGKQRRTFFFELGLTFNLLDAAGRIAYSKENNLFRLRACVIENRGPCQDVATGEVIDEHETWREVLATALDRALANTIGGLQAWAALLSRIRAQVESKLDGDIIKENRSAAQTRMQQEAGFPYLFLTVPSMSVKQLVQDLYARGEKPLQDRERQQLEQYLTGNLRTALDQALREELRRSKKIQQASIFVLPDATEIWFQDAMWRIISNAMNKKQYDYNVATGQDALRRHVDYFGRPCEAAELEGRNDLCLAATVLFRGSRTAVSPKTLNNLNYSMQMATVNAALTDPRVKRSGDPNNPRFYPRGRSQDVLIQKVASASDQYIRVRGEADNDDRVYLRAAALAAMRELGQVVAKRLVVPTFREELLR